MIWLISFFLFSANEPYKVNDDGIYFYKVEKSKETKEKTKHGEVIKRSDGVYFYKAEDDNKRSLENAYGDVQKIKGDASYYEIEKSPQDKAVTIQLNSMTFEDFKVGNTSFEEIYEKSNGVLLDFEWHKATSLVKLGYIFSSGIHIASGKGRFSSSENQNLTPKEKYSLFMVPLTAKIRFNFKYSDKQYVVPYFDLGAGVYGIIERRDDGDDTTQAHTPILIAGGGFNILLDWLSPESIAKVDNEFGINHMWLNIAYNLISATDNDFDLSSSQLQFGLKFDY